MRNITMTIHSRPLVYRSQSNSIGLSGMAAVTSRADTKTTTIKGANPPKFYPSNQCYSNYLADYDVLKPPGRQKENI